MDGSATLQRLEKDTKNICLEQAAEQLIPAVDRRTFAFLHPSRWL